MKPKGKNKMRFLVILIITIIFLGCVSDSTSELTIKKGDYVSIDYVGRLDNGKVFDTTIKEIGENRSIPKVEWYNNSNYTPLNFTIGFHRYVFEDYLIGMKKGERKTIVIPPEKAYGDIKEELIVSTPRITSFPKVMGFPLYEFIRGAKVIPEVNKIVKLRYWNVKILKVDEENGVVVVEHLVENNSIIRIPLGKIRIKFNKSYVIAELNPVVNKTIKVDKNKYAKVIDVNKTYITIDYNHPLAGKKLIYEIIVRDIRRGWPSG